MDLYENCNFFPINDFLNNNQNFYEYIFDEQNSNNIADTINIENGEFNKDIASSKKQPIIKNIYNDFETFNIKTCFNISTSQSTNGNIPSYISLDNIKNILLCHNKKNKNIVDIIIPGNNTKKCHNFFNQINDNNNYNDETKYLFKISKKNARKYDIDEMVMKIKSNVTKYIIELINSLIKEKSSKNTKKMSLLPLKYKLISRPMDRIFNIELLNQPIYKILSNDISGKFPKKNYCIINNIINTINKEYLIIKKALELTWGDYLDIFRYNYTEKIKEKIENNNLNEIKNKFDKIDSFICELYVKKYDNDNEKKDYLSSILLLTYNYERYFILKKIKNKKKIKIRRSKTK